MQGLDVGIAFDLRTDLASRVAPDAPDDRLEEYDSEATIVALEAAIRSAGHRPRRLGGGRALVERLLGSPPDLVFNIAEGFGTRSREAHAPALAELLGVPITHSDPTTLALSLDKALTKLVAHAAGVAVARGALVEQEVHLERTDTLTLPLIVKPNAEGSSMGIRDAAVVHDRAALRARVKELLTAYGQPVLVEELLTGAELTVGVLGTGSAARVIGTMEIAPREPGPGPFIYSLEAKRNYQTRIEYFVPPRLPREQTSAAEALALRAHRALGCRDVSRVDLRLDGRGQPHLIELNPLPGLNPDTGDLPILARRSGLTYEGLIHAIIDSARTR